MLKNKLWRTKEKMIERIYKNQKSSSKRRGDKAPSYDSDSFKKWCLKQKIFHELYNKWEANNCNIDMIPSIDRLDDYEGYSFGNIRITTWGENNSKGLLSRKDGSNNKRNKAVIMIDVKTKKIIKKFISMREAKREGFNDTCICMCCQGKQKSHKGYEWKYVM